MAAISLDYFGKAFLAVGITVSLVCICDVYSVLPIVIYQQSYHPHNRFLCSVCSILQTERKQKQKH